MAASDDESSRGAQRPVCSFIEIIRVATFHSLTDSLDMDVEVDFDVRVLVRDTLISAQR